MDITSLNSINSQVIRAAAENGGAVGKNQRENGGNMFSSVFSAAIDNLNTTNGYIADAAQEKMKLAMGETDSTHDLTIASQKASTCLQYTVAIRDKFMEAYKEIMQMQI